MKRLQLRSKTAAVLATGAVAALIGGSAAFAASDGGDGDSAQQWSHPAQHSAQQRSDSAQQHSEQHSAQQRSAQQR